MKSDLATSIAIAIVGVLIAYFTCNLLTGEIPGFSFSAIDSSTSSDFADLAEPNPEIFNYKAINPTVEVYVGNGSSDTNQGNQ